MSLGKLFCGLVGLEVLRWLETTRLLMSYPVAAELWTATYIQFFNILVEVDLSTSPYWKIFPLDVAKELHKAYYLGDVSVCGANTGQNLCRRYDKWHTHDTFRWVFISSKLRSCKAIFSHGFVLMLFLLRALKERVKSTVRLLTWYITSFLFLEVYKSRAGGTPHFLYLFFFRIMHQSCV